MDKIKKLSQAIRLGATFRPKATNFFFIDSRSCAQGAAFEAITGDATEVVSQADKERIQQTLKARFNVTQDLLNEVAYRNNGSKGKPEQTREQIADWLEAQGL